MHTTVTQIWHLHCIRESLALSKPSKLSHEYIYPSVGQILSDPSSAGLRSQSSFRRHPEDSAFDKISTSPPVTFCFGHKSQITDVHLSQDFLAQVTHTRIEFAVRTTPDDGDFHRGGSTGSIRANEVVSSSGNGDFETIEITLLTAACVFNLLVH
ncbi:hypothetical protein CDAR_503991 [Caerostris darwini]|uniref:Uncharacterized protein n=1 Tax=Caerostris darwini TaxID=1538125 RepID=A0AAV4T8Y6_9ARAC|nr:hypothetical protein CDAR_503991 [Caerostris darwini]